MLAIYCRTSRNSDNDPDNQPIDQQKEAGIKFANAHNFAYKIYIDAGKSGFTIDDDNTNPFSNRPQFQELINDIKNSKIDSVWVWENSRLSRNNYASQLIYKIFIDNNITLWEKDKEFNLSDPQIQMVKGILDVFSQYERNMIVSRTTRGLYNAINQGRRSFSHFFGYNKTDLINNNFTYKADEEKLKQVKIAYDLFLKGYSLRQIANEISENELITQKEKIKLATKWGRILAHEEYTGYALNIEGMKIENSFNKNEIGSLEQLHDKNKYWVKSKVYPVEIISIENWIKCREKLQIFKRNRNKILNKNRSSESSLSTGIVNCSSCNSAYYLHKVKGNYKGKISYSLYYTHKNILRSIECSQHPRTIKKEKLDNIMRFFYVFHSLIFNDRKHKTKEAINSLKVDIKTIKFELQNNEREIEKFENLIKIADENILNNPELFIEITRQQKIYNEKLKTLRIEKAELEIQQNNLNDQIDYNEKLLTFKFSQADILQFLFFDSVEEQRNKLLQTIQFAKIYSYYILIKADDLYFIFKIDKNDKQLKQYLIPEELYNGQNDLIKSFWNNYTTINFKETKSQEYLKNLFNWKNFFISDEKINLDIKFDIPENSTVIYFDETLTPEERKKIQQKKINEYYKNKRNNK